MNYQFSNDGNGQIIESHGEVISYGSADSCSILPYIGDPIPTPQYVFHTNWCSCCYRVGTVKSAREQVIDEILTKMADAVSKDDFKTAKVLAQLAKAVKEL